MYFKTIQLLRALAALFIVLYHDLYWWNQKQDAFTGLFDRSNRAIDLFFVISGFVVFQSAQTLPKGIRPSLIFITRRLIRVYALYWILLLTFLLTGLVSMTSIQPWAFLKAFFVLPGHEPVIVVSWTLAYEIYFYLLAGLYVLDKRFLLLFIFLFLFGAGAYLTRFSPAGGIHLSQRAFNNEFVLEFFLGASCVYFYRKIPLYLSIVMSLAGLILFLFPLPGMHLNTLGYALPSLLIVAGLTSLECHRKIPVPKPILSIGDASYALYLVHWPILYFILDACPPAWSANRAFQLALILAIIALSIVVHKWVEAPALRKLNSLLPVYANGRKEPSVGNIS